MTVHQFAPAQVKHESEIQRQHVRVKVPAKIQIAGALYNLRDLSVSGFAADGIPASFTAGQEITAMLMIPFSGFAFHSELRSQVEYVNTKQKILGCRFSSLTDDQLSVLNTVIKAYMAGLVVTQDDILKTVSRENYFKPRLAARSKKNSILTVITRALFSLLFMLAGVALAAFIAGNLYEKLSVIQSQQASVSVETLALRAPADGIFESRLPAGANNISSGQQIGTIEAPGKTPLMLLSPCNCLIETQQAQNHVLIRTGEMMFKLAPEESAPAVKAVIPSVDAQRLRIGSRARIDIAGEAGTFAGGIAAMEAQDTASSSTVVTLRPDQALPPALSGRPASVTFYLK